MSGVKSDMNINQWAEFESALEDLSNSGDTRKLLADELKSRIVGEDVMTDAQHRMIIALIVCELRWNAIDAWKFIVRNIPHVKCRLSKRAIRETDLKALYQEIDKKDASKLINILKSIARRRKK